MDLNSQNIFAEMQMLAESESSIKEHRLQLNKLVKFMQTFKWQEQELIWIAELRKLDLAILKDAEGFMVLDDLPVVAIPEEFRHDSFGFVYGKFLVYSGRFVLPVKDVYGDVMGFVGYDKFERPKYLDSVNYGYKAKQTMGYGMENLAKYYKDGYCLFPEGPMCALWMRSQGINAISLLGSYISPYMATIMERFGFKAIIVPDTDDSGNKLKRNVKYLGLQAQVWQVLKAKDTDDARQLDDEVADVIKQKIVSPFFMSEVITTA